MNRIRIILFLALPATLPACVIHPVDDKEEMPNIVEVFACGDYCPGPEEQYIKRVYEGVTDEERCRELGGRPYTYVGWGERTVCEVE